MLRVPDLQFAKNVDPTPPTPGYLTLEITHPHDPGWKLLQVRCRASLSLWQRPAVRWRRPILHSCERPPGAGGCWKERQLDRPAACEQPWDSCSICLRDSHKTAERSHMPTLTPRCVGAPFLMQSLVVSLQGTYLSPDVQQDLDAMILQ